MRILIRWVISAVALYLTVLIGQALGLGLALKPGVASAFVAVAVLALVNAVIGGLLRLLTLPINCLTFGLLGLIINALMFLLVGRLDVGLIVPNFLAALFGSVVMGILFGILNTFVGDLANRREESKK